MFDKPVNNLPNSITHLTFECHFNQAVNILPTKNLGFAFNNNIKNNIPENIENIEIIFFNNQNDSIITYRDTLNK